MALCHYLQMFFLEEDDDEDGRKDFLSSCVANNDFMALKTFLTAGDQFYEEPLFHMLNQGTKDVKFTFGNFMV